MPNTTLKPQRRLKTEKRPSALRELFTAKDPGQRREAGYRITTFVAAAALCLMAVLSFALPLRPTYSESELRTLSQFPTPTWESVMSGEFFSGVDTWFADTFPLRERFIALSASLESLYGYQSTVIHGDVQQGDEIPDAPAKPPIIIDEPDQVPEDTPAVPELPPLPEIPELDPAAKVETLGALLVIDDAAYEYYNFVASTATDYITTVERAAASLAGDANVYNILIPNSMDICVPESVRAKITTSSQRDAINYFYGSYSDNVKTVDIYDTMLRHSVDGEYLYFRTDHHWTALGAYYAYCDFMAAAGGEAADLKTDFTEHIFEGFTGSFVRETNNAAMKENPDTVYAYEPKSTNTLTVHWADGAVTPYNIITDVSNWGASSKYASGFIGGDNPLSIIENPNITDGSSIVLVKESYGNCFAPFLAESYQYVYVVDFRYYNDTQSGTLADLVREKGIDDVLFLNSISTTRSDGLVRQLARFVG
ncbi:MAG: hypothetical protein IJC58_03635 [Oscillospiraceae bacterium]|nr:hypothetical protein [Oscillospiraceae bacterium]